MDTLRTFIAIEIPADVRARVAAHIDRLRREYPDVRASWSREDNLHLTLKFLGNVPIERIPVLSTAVEQAAQQTHRFDLILRDCGAFPAHGRPKALWIGARDGTAGIPPESSHPPSPLPLGSLHAAIENGCEAAGFEREPRAFHPHLSIARLRKAAGSRRLAKTHKEFDFPAMHFTVAEIVVFKSELLREGSKHMALSRHQLVAK